MLGAAAGRLSAAQLDILEIPGATLADNPLGFPGHAYVVWRNSPDDRPIQAESVGYITQHYSDQFISPLVSVPGQLCCAPAQFEPSNLERLTVLVDSQTYQATLEARKKWNTAKFKAAQHDCLSFTTYIARTAGLVIPEYRCLYPQDQLCQLKQLNPQNVSCRPAGPYAFPRPVDCDHDP